MKTKVSKKISSLVLSLAIALTAVLSSSVPVNAAALSRSFRGEYPASEEGSAKAGVEEKIYFSVPNTVNITVAIWVYKNASDTSLALYNGSGTLVSNYADNPKTLSARKFRNVDNSWWTYFDKIEKLPAGDYCYGVTFSADTDYYILMKSATAEETPALNQPNATITVGFTKKLSVTGGTAESWKSSNTKVATVDKNGKVTAQKTGKATITVKCTDGTTLTCEITVKANKFTGRKITLSNVLNDRYGFEAYSASFDKKGNLVVKARYANNSSLRILEIRNLKVTVKDVNGKTVGIFKQSKKKVSISPYSTKDFTFTIKKSGLKKKKADLRNGSIVIDEKSYGK